MSNDVLRVGVVTFFNFYYHLELFSVWAGVAVV